MHQSENTCAPQVCTVAVYRTLEKPETSCTSPIWTTLFAQFDCSLCVISKLNWWISLLKEQHLAWGWHFDAGNSPLQKRYPLFPEIIAICYIHKQKTNKQTDRWTNLPTWPYLDSGCKVDQLTLKTQKSLKNHFAKIYIGINIIDLFKYFPPSFFFTF